MTRKEFEKLNETVAYFGHWYDVIGEERVSILEKSIEYILELEKENAELKKGSNRLFLEGAKRVEELEEQIEKMKCCENCKFKDCNKSSHYQTCWYCTNKDKWKLRR